MVQKKRNKKVGRPSQAITEKTKHKNIHFINADLTGGMIDKTYSLCSRWRKHDPHQLLDFAENVEFRLPVKCDYVVSVNLLNQLDILIIDYLRKYHRLKSGFLSNLRRSIQQNHLSILPKGKSILVTDHEEIRLKDNGDQTGTENLLYVSLPEATNQQEWIWEFDNRKTYHPGWRTHMRVIAKYF